jgi:hypothetical protein
MKNKLLLSSALLGSLVIASSSYAQTTVTGSLALSLKSIDGQNTATNATGSQRAFGKEVQINIQNKGKLNNGMDYAAGFSLEQDGGQTGDFSDENVYIDFIKGDTTLTIGQDHIQNTNRTKGNFLGSDANELVSGNNYAAATAAGAGAAFIQSAGANPAQAMGVGIVQKTPFGSLSALYVPTNTNQASDDNVGNALGAASNVLESDRESAHEIGFEGNLGVKGLNVHYFYNEEQKNQGQTRDLQGLNYGASYNMGQITAGFTRKETEFGASTLERKQNEFGLAYAATPTLTLAANYTVVDSNAASAVDAKSKSIGIGYNLGPVSIVGQMAKMENVTNVTGTGDMDVAFVKVTTNF